MTYNKRSMFWILFGVVRDDESSGGAGGTLGCNAHRRNHTDLPKGTRLKWSLRKPDGRRVIKTADDRYFTIKVESE